jgi:hypothetical protein
MSSHAAYRSGEGLTFGGERRSAVVHELALVATARLAVRIAVWLTVAVLAVALGVHLAFAREAHRLLAYRFPGVPAEPAVAATVFAHNLHALLAIGGALLVTQAPYLVTPAAPPGRAHRTVQHVCEAVLAGGVVANVVVVGASFGAYGLRMVRAALPHGPVELAAYALALALYTEGRHRPLPARHVLAIAALSTAALGVAAVLETFVTV